MKISLIIPTYNRKDTILRAVDSVLGQSFKVDEIIVVDDGSTDGTGKLLEGYSNDVKVFFQENKGVSAARNFGIKNASHEWIAFLDSDDEWTKDKIKEQVDFHGQNPGILISQTNEVWIRNGQRVNQMKKNEKSSGMIFDKCMALCMVTPSSVLAHKSIFEKVGFFDEQMEVCEDYDLWLRIAREYEFGLVQDELIYKHGGHEDQLSTSFWGMDRYRIKALEKHLDFERYKDEIASLILKKSNILAKGAKKRGNDEVYEYYMRKIETLGEF